MKNDSYKLDPALKLLGCLEISSLSKNRLEKYDDIDENMYSLPYVSQRGSNVVVLHKEQHDKYDGYEVDEKIERLRFIIGINEKENNSLISKVRHCFVFRWIKKLISLLPTAIPVEKINLGRGFGVAVAATFIMLICVTSTGIDAKMARNHHDLLISDMREALYKIDNLERRVYKLEARDKHAKSFAVTLEDISKDARHSNAKGIASFNTIERLQFNKKRSEFISSLDGQPLSRDLAAYDNIKNWQFGPDCAHFADKDNLIKLFGSEMSIEINCNDKSRSDKPIAIFYNKN